MLKMTTESLPDVDSYGDIETDEDEHVERFYASVEIEHISFDHFSC